MQEAGPRKRDCCSPEYSLLYSGPRGGGHWGWCRLPLPVSHPERCCGPVRALTPLPQRDAGNGWATQTPLSIHPPGPSFKNVGEDSWREWEAKNEHELTELTPEKTGIIQGKRTFKGLLKMWISHDDNVLIKWEEYIRIKRQSANKENSKEIDQYNS